MSAANKAKGSRWEHDVETFLNEVGLKARRLPRSGVKDIGDVAIEGHKLTIVVEAKNRKRQDLATFVAEAELEAEHFEAKYNTVTVGVVVCKTPRKPVDQAKVTLSLDSFINLLKWGGVV